MQGKKKKEKKPMASSEETLAFAFDCGGSMKILFVVGVIGGILNGLVYPILAYVFSSSFSDIAGAASGIDKVRRLAFTFLIVAAYAFICGVIQTWSFEVFAFHATKRFRLEWFKALLRQDPSFFDVHDIGGISGQVGVSSNKYRRGVGRKFGEGIQFFTTGIGGFGFALYSSWRVALVVVSIVPFISLAALSVLQINQTKGSRAAASYTTASGVAYSSVSAIKTVLSLNAIQEMIDRYFEATLVAYNIATKVLIKQGLANGTSSSVFLNTCLILFLSANHSTQRIDAGFISFSLLYFDTLWNINTLQRGAW
jgi:ATP-binding cassette subfamily B (MDR/TAP) protein 1